MLCGNGTSLQLLDKGYTLQVGGHLYAQTQISRMKTRIYSTAHVAAMLGCQFVTRVIGFLLCLVFTIVSFQLATKNVLDMYVIHAVRMTDVAVERVTAFDVSHLPAMILFVSTVCSFIQLCVDPKHAVWVRWADWTITVPVMMALISALAGTRDVWMVAAHSFIALAVILSGILMDEIDSRMRWIAFALGNLLMTFAWISIIWHLRQTGAPDLVTGIVASQAFMFVCYPVTTVICRAANATLKNTEFAYAVLGTVTKLLLAMILVFGVRKTAST